MFCGCFELQANGKIHSFREQTPAYCLPLDYGDLEAIQATQRAGREEIFEETWRSQCRQFSQQTASRIRNQELESRDGKYTERSTPKKGNTQMKIVTKLSLMLRKMLIQLFFLYKRVSHTPFSIFVSFYDRIDS
jgi:hypothetical protein